MSYGVQSVLHNQDSKPISSLHFIRPIKRELAAAPDGARYTIYVQWKGRGSGAHVFIAEKYNGVVHYVDPQPGKEDVSHYFANGRKGCFGFFRMDDKQITTDQNIIAATVEVSTP